MNGTDMCDIMLSNASRKLKAAIEPKGCFKIKDNGMLGFTGLMAGNTGMLWRLALGNPLFWNPATRRLHLKSIVFDNSIGNTCDPAGKPPHSNCSI